MNESYPAVEKTGVLQRITVITHGMVEKVEELVQGVKADGRKLEVATRRSPKTLSRFTRCRMIRAWLERLAYSPSGVRIMHSIGME